jgi:excisionase family DNA binding protein
MSTFEATSPKHPSYHRTRRGSAGWTTSSLWTVEEAARALGISRSLAYALVRDGVIPSLRLGRRRVVPRSRLHALIEGAVTPVAVTHATERLGGRERRS